jgi:hypothetical protein
MHRARFDHGYERCNDLWTGASSNELSTTCDSNVGKSERFMCKRRSCVLLALNRSPVAERDQSSQRSEDHITGLEIYRVGIWGRERLRTRAPPFDGKIYVCGTAVSRHRARATNVRVTGTLTRNSTIRLGRSRYR